MDSSLSTIVLLLGPREGAVNLLECGVEDLARELLQVVLEGMGMEEFEDWSDEEGEGGPKWKAKAAR